MVIGESKVTNMVLKMISPEIKNGIDNYIYSICCKDFVVMKSIEQVKNIFEESINNFLNSLTDDELINLRSYTGYNFRNINSVLRGNWTYEINGNANRQQEYRELAKAVENIVSKFDIPKISFVTFRGTTLDNFSSYGINKLSDLKYLEGKFLYEQGFTSTSILEDTSYFNKTLEDGKFYNIEVRYLIPFDSNDGALLINNETSYSVNQNEFLLNSGSLTKVIDVKVDETTNTAVLVAVLIPKRVYDLGYVMSENNSKKV